jgi:hypothetical protein
MRPCRPLPRFCLALTSPPPESSPSKGWQAQPWRCWRAGWASDAGSKVLKSTGRPYRRPASPPARLLRLLRASGGVFGVGRPSLRLSRGWEFGLMRKMRLCTQPGVRLVRGEPSAGVVFAAGSNHPSLWLGLVEEGVPTWTITARSPQGAGWSSGWCAPAEGGDDPSLRLRSAREGVSPVGDHSKVTPRGEGASSRATTARITGRLRGGSGSSLARARVCSGPAVE